MIKNKVTELPKTIISIGLVQAKLEDWERLYKNMVDAYSKLPRHCGIEAIPFNPKEITVERFTNYVNKMIAGLNEDQKMVWKRLLSDATMNIKHVEAFFFAFPLAEFEVDGNPNTPTDKRFRCTNKEEVINAVAKVIVSDECRAYFEKVNTFADAMNEMRE